MGTKVHCKSYLPGYYSMRDLNEDSSSSNWLPFYGDKTISNGQYYNGYLPRSVTNLYPGYDKDALKQTVLEHEAIFKQQVFELHRLYKIQKDMMDEVRRKKLHKQQIPVETSSSSSPVIPQTPYEEAQKWHKSLFPLMKSSSDRPTVSSVEIINSPLSFMEGNIAQVGRISFHNGCSSKDCEVLESRSPKVRRKLFDLQLPADEYIDTDEGERSLDNKVSDCSSYPPNRNHNIAPESSSKIDLDVDASRSGSCLRSSGGLADLNEPVQVEELTTPTSVDFIGGTNGQREMKDLDLEAKPKSQFLLGLPKETLQNPVVSSDPCVENKGNGRNWLSYAYEAGHSKTHLSSMPQGLQPDKPLISSRLKHDVLDKAHQPSRNIKTDHSLGDPWRGRTAHDLELSEKGCNFSCLNHLEPVAASNISNPYLSVNSNMDNCWSRSISTWGKGNSSMTQNLTSIHMHPPLTSMGSTGRSSQSSIQSQGFFEDKWHLPSSGLKPDFGSGLPSHNGFYHGSSGSRDISYQFPSVGFESMNCNKDNKVASERSINCGSGSYLKGSNFVDIKSMKEMNLNRVPLESSSNGVVTQQRLLVIDEERTCVDNLKVLPWLKSTPGCENDGMSAMRDSNSSKMSLFQAASNSLSNKNAIVEGSHQPFTQNIASTSCEVDKGSRRNEEGDSMVYRKIFGFPIFSNSCTPKNESSSLISSSASLQCTPQGEGTKAENQIGVIDINLACNPESSTQTDDEALVAEKERDKNAANLRTHIDLNACASEDEIALEPAIASKAISVKIPVEIDLEAPALPESEDDCQPAEQKQHENQDEAVRVAAEAIVSISSSVQETDCCYPSEDFTADHLLWFVEVVSSHIDDTNSKYGYESRAKDIVDTEASASDEFDYFEAMTLKLAEVKEEEYMPKPLVLENPKVEETGPISLPGRPRRGQARRGRQRRDFQRDILPGLASLSRHEVTEDLQTFGGLMRATGHPWHSGLARRNSTRNGAGRGRRRAVPDPAPTTEASMGPTLLIQQLNNIEVGLEDRSLTGWGKAPRRPRRQRCPAAVGNPPSIPLT
ncbi:hypothetical protein NMG60_11009292 [Bertholletia excelsa]